MDTRASIEAILDKAYAARRAEDAEAVVEIGPDKVAGPLAEDRVHGLPRRKADREQAPGNAAFDDVKDGIQDEPAIGVGTASFGELGEEGVDERPLGVGQAGFVMSDFHRPTGLRLDWQPTHSRPQSSPFARADQFFTPTKPDKTEVITVF